MLGVTYEDILFKVIICHPLPVAYPTHQAKVQALPVPVPVLLSVILQ